MIRLPLYELERLEKYISLDNEVQSNLLEQLEKLIHIPDEKFIKDLAEELKLNENQILEIVQFILNLFINFHESDLEKTDYILEIKDSIIFENFENLIPKKDDWSKLEKSLSLILEKDSTIGIWAKSFRIWSEHDKIFQKSRILTDIRPIFFKKVSDPPKFAIIAHNMKITYHKNGKLKTEFILIDSKDLNKFHKTIERALEKEKSLKDFCEKNNIKIIVDE